MTPIMFIVMGHIASNLIDLELNLEQISLNRKTIFKVAFLSENSLEILLEANSCPKKKLKTIRSVFLCLNSNHDKFYNTHLCNTSYISGMGGMSHAWGYTYYITFTNNTVSEEL